MAEAVGRYVYRIRSVCIPGSVFLCNINIVIKTVSPIQIENIMHLSLVVYRIRLNTVYNRLVDNKVEQAKMLFERYSSSASEDVAILPKIVDDYLITQMFLGEIMATLGLRDACKHVVEETLLWMDAYELQQAMIVRRMKKMTHHEDELGTLYLLPNDCLHIIANHVLHGLL